MIEGTTKNGEYHGLVRKIFEGIFLFEIFNQGEQLAFLEIHFDTNEAYEEDPHGYFAELELSDFMDHELVSSLEWK